MLLVAETPTTGGASDWPTPKCIRLADPRVHLIPRPITLKVRDELPRSYDQDPGWYEYPPGYPHLEGGVIGEEPTYRPEFMPFRRHERAHGGPWGHGSTAPNALPMTRLSPGGHGWARSPGGFPKLRVVGSSPIAR